jgi:hypothetical protein
MLAEQAREHLQRVLVEATGDLDELQKVNPALASLDLPDERV